MFQIIRISKIPQGDIRTSILTTCHQNILTTVLPVGKHKLSNSQKFRVLARSKLQDGPVLFLLFNCCNTDGSLHFWMGAITSHIHSQNVFPPEGFEMNLNVVLPTCSANKTAEQASARYCFLIPVLNTLYLRHVCQ